MIGIEQIASYIPESRISNYDRKEKFDMDDNFIENKIGVKEVSILGSNEETSDLCVKAYKRLIEKIEIDETEIGCLIVVTQNPDYNIPHTSAIVHGKLNLPESIACFDISLGCSGYVYGLSVIENFMQNNGYSKGLLFTADPYSKVLNEDDKNTSVLFGDAASVTLMSNTPILKSGKFSFGTIGKDYEELICKNNVLSMNGRAIFNFAAKYVPKDINYLMEINDEDIENIDLFLLHQGSKYIVDTIRKRLKIDEAKVPFVISDYGNTVSSSLPLILEQHLENKIIEKIVISGFGVGLSWGSVVLFRN